MTLITLIFIIEFFYSKTSQTYFSLCPCLYSFYADPIGVHIGVGIASLLHSITWMNGGFYSNLPRYMYGFANPSKRYIVGTRII